MRYLNPDHARALAAAEVLALLARGEDLGPALMDAARERRFLG